jgi:integrase/recombinase XerD
MLTGARDGAIGSLRLKHIDLAQGCVYLGARAVKTKFAKTLTTTFFPVESQIPAVLSRLGGLSAQGSSAWP